MGPPPWWAFERSPVIDSLDALQLASAMGSMDVDLDGLSEDEMGVPPNTVSPAAAFIAGNAAGGAVWPAPVVSSLPLAPAPAMAPRQCQIDVHGPGAH